MHQYCGHEAAVRVVCVPRVCLELVFHEKHVFELSFPVRGLDVSEKSEF